jgi:hypothetical protein
MAGSAKEILAMDIWGDDYTTLAKANRMIVGA